jgi:hypothetical protein
LYQTDAASLLFNIPGNHGCPFAVFASRIEFNVAKQSRLRANAAGLLRLRLAMTAMEIVVGKFR